MVDEMYNQAHAAIIAGPGAQAVEKRRWNRVKLSNAQRKARVAQKKEAFLKTLKVKDS